MTLLREPKRPGFSFFSFRQLVFQRLTNTNPDRTLELSSKLFKFSDCANEVMGLHVPKQFAGCDSPRRGRSELIAVACIVSFNVPLNSKYASMSFHSAPIGVRPLREGIEPTTSCSAPLKAGATEPTRWAVILRNLFIYFFISYMVLASTWRLLQDMRNYIATNYE